jgi:hypothetical protein
MKAEELKRTTKRISATLQFLVDMKVDDTADIKNLIERLECACVNASGEDASIIDVKILDRKLLIEGDADVD